MPSVLRALQFTSDQVSARGELTEVGSTIRFQEVTNDTGVGSLFVGRGEPALSAASSRPEIGRIIRVDVDTTPAFPWFIEQMRYVHLAERGGKAVEGWALRGRGTLSVFERAVVWPPLGVGRALFSDLRCWNFASPELDDTSWDTAVATELAHVGFNFGLVELFPDTQAEWIWDREVGGGIGTGDNAPQGTCYFSTTFTAASAMNHEMWLAADDSHEPWIDGVQIMVDPGYYKGNVRRTKPFALDAGDHSIRVRATNQNAAKAGILGTIIEVNPDGTYGNVVCRTDETWKVLSYPDDPPGFTVGQILRILLDEAQDRNNLLDGVFVDFSDTQDTDGNNWPMLTEFSARIGSSYYSVIRQLCETEIDVKMHATALTLSAWNKGAAGSSKAILFDNATGNPAVDNIRTLTHEVSNVGAVVP